MLSRFGLQALLNDGASSAPVIQGNLATAITWASVRINFYLLQRHDPTQLVGNDFVRFACATLAAVMIMRRKNAAHDGLQQEYDEVEEQLEAIQTFKYEVPLAYPISEPGPSHSNVRVDQWSYDLRIRVDPNTSSNQLDSRKLRILDPASIVLEW
jgi:hypothetical protein